MTELKYQVTYLRQSYQELYMTTSCHVLESDDEIEQVAEMLCVCGLRVDDTKIIMPAAIIELKVLSEP